jgi:hypothetical protein
MPPPAANTEMKTLISQRGKPGSKDVKRDFFALRFIQRVDEADENQKDVRP